MRDINREWCVWYDGGRAVPTQFRMRRLWQAVHRRWAWLHLGKMQRRYVSYVEGVSKMVWGKYNESRAIQLRDFVLVTKFPKGDGRRCGDIERVDAALHRNSGHVVGLSQDGVAQAVAFRAQ